MHYGTIKVYNYVLLIMNKKCPFLIKLWESIYGEWSVLLHPAAVVAKDFAFFTQVLRMLFALVRHIQPIRFLQGALEQKKKERKKEFLLYSLNQ